MSSELLLIFLRENATAQRPAAQGPATQGPATQGPATQGPAAHACEQWVFSKVLYRKADFVNKIAPFLTALLRIYPTQKHPYLKGKPGYTRFLTVIRQICNAHPKQLRYETRLVYNHSTYEIEYDIYFTGARDKGAEARDKGAEARDKGLGAEARDKGLGAAFGAASGPASGAEASSKCLPTAVSDVSTCFAESRANH